MLRRITKFRSCRGLFRRIERLPVMRMKIDIRERARERAVERIAEIKSGSIHLRMREKNLKVALHLEEELEIYSRNMVFTV